MTVADRDQQQVWIERLEARQAELVERLGRVQADRRRSRGPLDPDFEEQVVERENDEVLDGLDELERRELRSIEAALERIEADCFGICDDCGEMIDPMRLDVQPAAERCLPCEEARERRAAPTS